MRDYISVEEIRESAEKMVTGLFDGVLDIEVTATKGEMEEFLDTARRVEDELKIRFQELTYQIERARNNVMRNL